MARNSRLYAVPEPRPRLSAAPIPGLVTQPAALRPERLAILLELGAQRRTLLGWDLAAERRARADPGPRRRASVEGGPGDAGAPPHPLVPQHDPAGEVVPAARGGSCARSSAPPNPLSASKSNARPSGRVTVPVPDPRASSRLEPEAVGRPAHVAVGAEVAPEPHGESRALRGGVGDVRPEPGAALDYPDERVRAVDLRGVMDRWNGHRRRRRRNQQGREHQERGDPSHLAGDRAFGG